MANATIIGCIAFLSGKRIHHALSATGGVGGDGGKTNPGLAWQVLLCRIPYVSKARDKGVGSRNPSLAGHCVGLHGFLGLPLRDAWAEETGICGKFDPCLPHRVASVRFGGV